MHKIHYFPVHRVSKKGHIGLQDSTTFTAGWDFETTHLLVCQEDIPIWSHFERFSFPGWIQSFKVFLKFRAQDLVSAGQAENPEIQSKVLMGRFSCQLEIWSL